MSQTESFGTADSRRNRFLDLLGREQEDPASHQAVPVDPDDEIRTFLACGGQQGRVTLGPAKG
jgi:hypothetical protein